MGIRALCTLALLCLTVMSIACNACGLAGGNPLMAQIGQAERRWQDQGIESYRLEVRFVRSIWHAQSHLVTVRDGAVVEESASCVPAPTESGKCEVEPFNAAEYTVPGLFTQARARAQVDEGQWTSVAFDPTYSFPSQISFDNPEVYDEDMAWIVLTFEVLE